MRLARPVDRATAGRGGSAARVRARGEGGVRERAAAAPAADVVVTKREVLRQLKAYKAEFGALDTEDVDVLTGDEQSFYMFEERAGGALYTSVVKPLAGSADPLVGKYVEAVFKVDATDDDEEGQSSMYEGRIITGFDGGMFPGVYLVQYSDCALELVTIEDGDTSEFPITLMNPQPNSIKFNTRPRSELLA